MQVNITKYPTHRWYHNFLNKVFGYIPDQAVYVKIDKWDTWSMDCTLAHIVAPMLRQLLDTSHSFASVDIEDRPEHLVGTLPTARYSGPDEFAEQAWDWVLSEMLFAFESKLTDWEAQFCSGEHDVVWTALDDTEHMEMRFGPNHTFKIDYQGRMKYQDRVSNGFRLFGKYYENLWD